MDLIEGGVLNFTVVAKNRFGTVVPVADAAVTLDNPALGVVTVGTDGSAGVFTAATGVVGDVNLVASAGGVQSTPFLVSVKADTAVASVELVPVVDVATVEIQPVA